MVLVLGPHSAMFRTSFRFYVQISLLVGLGGPDEVPETELRLALCKARPFSSNPISIFFLLILLQMFSLPCIYFTYLIRAETSPSVVDLGYGFAL